MSSRASRRLSTSALVERGRFIDLGRVLINRDCSAIAGRRKQRVQIVSEAQAIFFRRRQSGGNPTQLVRHERRRVKAVRQKVNRTPNGYASLVIRANERRRLKAIRQKYNRDPNGGLAMGLRRSGL